MFYGIKLKYHMGSTVSLFMKKMETNKAILTNLHLICCIHVSNTNWREDMDNLQLVIERQVVRLAAGFATTLSHDARDGGIDFTVTKLAVYYSGIIYI